MERSWSGWSSGPVVGWWVELGLLGSQAELVGAVLPGVEVVVGVVACRVGTQLREGVCAGQVAVAITGPTPSE